MGQRKQSIDMARVQQILEQDPEWSAYAIADLQPSFAPYCRWFVTSEDEEDGVVLLFTALDPPILLAVGTPAAVTTLLDGAMLPERVFISARHEHLPLIQQWYRFDLPEQGTSLDFMKRMVFCHPEALTDLVPSTVIRLGAADAPQIDQLLTHGGAFTPDAFDPFQLDNGVFYGITSDDGELLAMGGTHIVDWTGGVGAVGNMYTHPDYRGRGYARLLLSAVVGALQTGGVETIVLNVNETNTVARRLYTEHGFAIHCDFVEGIGVKCKT